MNPLTNKTPQATNLKVLTEKTQSQLSLFETPVPAEPLLPATSFQQKVRKFEEILALQPQNIPGVTHHLAPGVYGRELVIPRGAVITGKIHRHAHLNIVTYGRCTVATPDGVREIVGPCVFTSLPGTKRALYAHEETQWLTIHPTEETDLAKIEDHVITTDDGEWASLIETARNAIATAPPSEMRIIEEGDEA
jgi:hypothetical protein